MFRNLENMKVETSKAQAFGNLECEIIGILEIWKAELENFEHNHNADGRHRKFGRLRIRE